MNYELDYSRSRPNHVIWLAISLALALSSGGLQAQNGPASGLYRITSGQYSGCSGIAWVPPAALSCAAQAFIELNIDRDKNLAQMKILAEDMKTVFSDSLGVFPPFPLS